VLLGLLGGLAGPRARAGFGPVSLFFSSSFFYSFLFLFSFKTFAKELKIDSNQFVNLPKIVHNILNSMILSLNSKNKI
jgi:hypothetical protein